MSAEKPVQRPEERNDRDRQGPRHRRTAVFECRNTTARRSHSQAKLRRMTFAGATAAIAKAVIMRGAAVLQRPSSFPVAYRKRVCSRLYGLKGLAAPPRRPLSSIPAPLSAMISFTSELDVATYNRFRSPPRAGSSWTRKPRQLSKLALVHAEQPPAARNCALSSPTRRVTLHGTLTQN